MADLDLSRHSLNQSGAKQKYSFSKTKRFMETNNKLCDSLYDLPSTTTKRGTSLGYGNKQSMGNEHSKFIPGVGAYTFQNNINPQKHKNQSFTFGVSRQRMDLGGPLGQLKFLKNIPSPNAYNEKDVHDKRGTTMRARPIDRQIQKLANLPGPGAYESDNMGGSKYYLCSSHKNDTNIKISQLSRVESIGERRKPKIGPSDYNPVDSLNGGGRYSLTNHQSVNSCVFSRSQRQGMTQKTQKGFPGPGAYKSFSSFG